MDTKDTGLNHVVLSTFEGHPGMTARSISAAFTDTNVVFSRFYLNKPHSADVFFKHVFALYSFNLQKTKNVVFETSEIIIFKSL